MIKKLNDMVKLKFTKKALGALALTVLMLFSNINNVKAQQTLYVNSTWSEGSCGSHTWGVDAFATIQEAVNTAIVSDGAVTISVAEGTYNENVHFADLIYGVRYPKENLKFTEGETTYYGRLNIVAEKGTVLNGQFTTLEGGAGVNYADITIKGFTINTTSMAIYIDNSTADSKNVSILNNTFNTTSTGLYVISGNVESLTISGNNFKNTSGYCAIIGGATCNINKATVSGNTFGSFIGVFGQVLTDGVEVSGNTFTGVAEDDENLWINNLKAKSTGKITVSGNTFSSTYKYVLGFKTIYDTKADITIGEGNTYGGQTVTDWAKVENGIFIVSSDAASGEALYYDQKLYLGDETAFKTLGGATAAAQSGNTIIVPSGFEQTADFTLPAGVNLNVQGATFKNSFISNGNLSMENSSVNVTDGSAKHDTTEGSYTYNNHIRLSGNATLKNPTIQEILGSDNTWQRVRGMYVSENGTDIQIVTEADKTSTIFFDRDKVRTRSQTGWTYGIALGGSSGDDNAKMTFSGAGDVNISGNTTGGGDASSPYGWSINGFRVNGAKNKLSFGNTGKTTITVSSQYGVNGLVSCGAIDFTAGTVLVNTYIDGGVAFSNNIGLYNSDEATTINVTEGVDEMTVFIEGAAYYAKPGSGDISNGAAAIYGVSYSGGAISIKAKKLNVLAISGEDTNKEWTIGNTKVTGHTIYSTAKAAAVGADKYSTTYGILNKGQDHIFVGANTDTYIKTRDTHLNSVAVAAMPYVEGDGESEYVESDGGIEILGNTNIVAEGETGTLALYAARGNHITVGSEGKTVNITGDILSTGSYNNIASSITIQGSTNVITGNMTIKDGAILNIDYSGIALTGACNSSEGAIVIDMTGATDDSYVLIAAIEGSDYGILGVNYKFAEGKDNGYALKVDGNVLKAVLPVAYITIGETTTYYGTVADAITAAGSTDVITMLASTSENVTIPAEKTVTLDLNGKVISASDNTKTVITNEGVLTLTDGVGGGNITGGTTGVAQNGTLTLSGNVNITGNGTGDNRCNLYLPSSDKTFSISDPAERMKVGVSKYGDPSQGDITLTGTYTSDYSGYFFSDVPQYSVLYKNKVLVLTSDVKITISAEEGVETLELYVDGTLVQGTSAYVPLGKNVTIKTTPIDGYAFKGWYKKDGTMFNGKFSHTFNATESLDLEAKFTDQVIWIRVKKGN